MCTQTNYIPLAEHELGNITLCRGCMQYSFNYTNSVFSFSRAELISFKEILCNFEETDFCYSALGQSRAMLKSQYSNLGFSVSRYDIEVISNMVSESLVLSEVYELLGATE